MSHPAIDMARDALNQYQGSTDDRVSLAVASLRALVRLIDNGSLIDAEEFAALSTCGFSVRYDGRQNAWELWNHKPTNRFIGFYETFGDAMQAARGDA